MENCLSPSPTTGLCTEKREEIAPDHSVWGYTSYYPSSRNSLRLAFYCSYTSQPSESLLPQFTYTGRKTRNSVGFANSFLVSYPGTWNIIPRTQDILVELMRQCGRLQRSNQEPGTVGRVCIPTQKEGHRRFSSRLSNGRTKDKRLGLRRGQMRKELNILEHRRASQKY